MSSIDELSLISGISNISRISRTNNSTLYKFDTSCNNSEWRSICRDINKSLTSDSQKTDSRNTLESAKVNKALSSCEESICEYAKLRCISDCFEEIIDSNNSSIEKNTMKKLKQFLTIYKIKKYLHLPNNSKDLKEELTLLGIIDLPKIEFNYEEQLMIKSCLEAKLREKIHNFLSIYENLAGSTKDVLKNNESILRARFQKKGELENLNWKDKIEEVCLEYKRDLIQCIKMFSQWNEFKHKMNEHIFKESENLLLKAEIAEMKAIITKLSCTIRMFKETPITVEAFKILNTTLNEKISNCTDEIAEKIELKKAYDALSSTEYDEILKKYLELSYIIKKKKNLLDQL